MTQKAILAIGILFVYACSAQNTITGLTLGDLVGQIAPNDKAGRALMNQGIQSLLTGYKKCGFEKECVPRYLCRNDEVLTDGGDILEALGEENCDISQVCCHVRKKVTLPPVPTSRQGTMPDLGSKNRPTGNPNFPTSSQGCGIRNPSGIGFFSGKEQSEQAEFGEFPWMVAILDSDDEQTLTYRCGGSILAWNVILTATHCVRHSKLNETFVRAGEWDLHGLSEILPYQDRRVKEIITHEQFNKGALHNDVALLILEIPFVPQDHVNRVCLPEANLNFDHSRCFLSGWGKDKYGRDGVYQHILKKVEMPIVPHGQCETNLRKTRLGHQYELDESFICAGGEVGKSACQGDGGSPLVCPDPSNPQRFYQVGLVAFGIGCGAENIPGIYSNIPYLRSWIDEKLRANGIDSSYYTN